MYETERTVETPCSAEAAFAHIGAGFFENHSRWDPDVKKMTKASDAPVGVGTTGQEHRKVPGRTIVSDIRITEFEPPRRFGFESTSGPMRERVSWQLEPTSTGTRIRTSLSFAARAPAMRLFAPVMRRMIARNVERNMENFRRALSDNCD